MMNVQTINIRIKNEICHDALIQLTDEKLMTKYKECKSVKKSIHALESILSKYVDTNTQQKIIQEYLIKLIPAGTKGVIRGNVFNSIVKNKLLKMNLDKNKFDLCFEKQCVGHITAEKPDWYIYDKTTKKVLIGMNQLDLWGGGQQLNRGTKYVENNAHNNETCKFLCVVCNEIQLKSENNKIYKLFDIGFSNNTLCYINNLSNIVNTWFNLDVPVAQNELLLD